ncbi:MAG TPA: hypothetical protein VNE62_11260, partial [Actinomycetota bacterium]|nr:hypothetical protein [Actinomycetota bacterium]
SGDVRGAGSWADAALGQAGSDVSRRAALHAKAGVDLADNRLESAADALTEALQLVPRLSANQYPRLPVLELMVRVEAAAGRAGRAAVLLGWAESIRSREAVPMPSADRPVLDTVREDLRRELGEEAYSAAVERGAGMTPDEATAFALNRE